MADNSTGSEDHHDDEQPLMSLRARRRILVAMGYGFANAAVAAAVGWRPRTGTPAEATSTIVNLTSSVRLGMPPALPDAGPEPTAGHVHALVVANGRVVDPDSGFDGVADVGIDEGVITRISLDRLRGRDVIDATGRVVAPGFIDLLSYEPNPFGIWYKLADGVTTNLAMHGISNYAEPFFRRYEGSTPVHFGGAFHQHFIRGQIGIEVEDEPSPAQLAELEDLARSSLAEGFAGISFSPEYSPGTSSLELLRLTEIVAQAGHVAFFHVRYSDPDPPGTSMEAVAEVLDLARRTGVPVHIEHISSTGGTFVMAETLNTLDAARAEGLDVTACLYPYDFWGTFLASARFSAGWRDRFGLAYEDLQIAGTERRLTETTYEEAWRANKLVAALGSIPEEEVQMALRHPWTMVASDAILDPDRNNHPRAAGTFARLLGRYVRELGVLDLPTALAKITILPARRMEGMIPAMARKGRLQRGADADLVVFNPLTVADQATVAAPDSPSVGIDWVLVAGQMALREGTADRSVVAGQALRSVVRPA